MIYHFPLNPVEHRCFAPTPRPSPRQNEMDPVGAGGVSGINTVAWRKFRDLQRNQRGGPLTQYVWGCLAKDILFSDEDSRISIDGIKCLRRTTSGDLKTALPKIAPRSAPDCVSKSAPRLLCAPGWDEFRMAISDYHLGKRVSVSDDGGVFRATDREIEVALKKHKKIPSGVSVEMWLEMVSDTFSHHESRKALSTLLAHGEGKNIRERRSRMCACSRVVSPKIWKQFLDKQVTHLLQQRDSATRSRSHELSFFAPSGVTMTLCHPTSAYMSIAQPMHFEGLGDSLISNISQDGKNRIDNDYGLCLRVVVSPEGEVFRATAEQIEGALRPHSEKGILPEDVSVGIWLKVVTVMARLAESRVEMASDVMVSQDVQVPEEQQQSPPELRVGPSDQDASARDEALQVAAEQTPPGPRLEPDERGVNERAAEEAWVQDIELVIHQRWLQVEEQQQQQAPPSPRLEPNEQDASALDSARSTVDPDPQKNGQVAEELQQTPPSPRQEPNERGTSALDSARATVDPDPQQKERNQLRRELNEELGLKLSIVRHKVAARHRKLLKSKQEEMDQLRQRLNAELASKLDNVRNFEARWHKKFLDDQEQRWVQQV